MLKIYPGKISGSINAPASKSMGHRALICASLALGKSKISNIGSSKDIEATINVLRKLGAKIEVKDNEAIVDGIDPKMANENIMDCNESGSTLRFLIPLFTLNDKLQTFTGHGKLMSRPLDLYEKIYEYFKLEGSYLKVKGPLKAGEFHLDGSISSQFFTGLLFALPLLDNDSKIVIENKLESKSYIDMTIDVLSAFGVNVDFKDNILTIKGGQKYTARDYVVEGDYSGAAFLKLLSEINNDIEIKGLNTDSKQGDKVFFDFVKEIKNDKPVFDLKDCPDLGPALMVLSCLSKKDVVINSIERLRIKESDRVNCMIDELKKFGFNIEANEHSMFIKNSEMLDLEDIEIDAHNDHRIAMALSSLATIYSKPVIILDEKCVSKSYPDFYKDLKHLGIKMEEL